LRSLNRDNGLTIVLIEHVMRAVMALASNVLVLDHGIAIAQGKPEAIVHDPGYAAPYVGLADSYNLLREDIHVKPGETDATGATNETADPQQQVALRSSMDLPGSVTLDAALRWVDKLRVNNSPTAGPVVGIVPSYFGLDARLAWHVSDKLELSVAGQNLLHDRHTEYGFPSPAREQITRGVFGKITWGY